jgi:hypothetical protein
VIKTCIFCGRRADSVEHAWPEWLLALIADLGPPSLTEAQFGPEGAVVSWVGPEITVSCLCRVCNSGWLSRLETEAKPILTPLIHDIAVPLDRAVQEILARWSVKTAMVFDATKRRRFYGDSERRALRATSTLPPFTGVWLGRYGQSNLLCGEGRHLDENKSRDRNPFADGYATTFVVRRLVIQLATIPRKPEFDAFDAKLHLAPGPWDKSLIQVWPTAAQSAKWPPVLSFSDGGMDFSELSRRFVAKRSRSAGEGT